ncbi:hypothetical protein EJ04DRAFT_551756 [Polyplosphaeria fusca]|uniref:Zn(2)-C6 fungal-type domain-containing protein n=1 Tax=Polyplosphaeria fusca TaxID=682080 RepID=A0A9P4R2Q5_9PLEO|nr:hypothetical protein EJ04DRAFT_551756 [Polyplosphaeria fusca]
MSTTIIPEICHSLLSNHTAGSMMMECESRQFPQSPPFLLPHYFYSDRNAPLSFSQGDRPDPRAYPITGSMGGLRSRPPPGGQDEGSGEVGQARKRVALACARCRKRKIRCSGDPGNGTGCQNCKLAGVDPELCQFHRVGSIPSSMTDPNAMMPIYNAAASKGYSRTFSTGHYPQIDNRSTFASQTWAVPYTEDTSPVEVYGLDQSAAYIPSQNTMTNVYGDSYRWGVTHQRALHGAGSVYVPPDYTPSSFPYLSTPNMRSTVISPNESMCGLNNMSLLHSNLPTTSPTERRLHPRYQISAQTPVAQRQLPIPQPSPAQISKNTVDKMQDDLLRSAQAIGGSSFLTSGAYAKSSVTWDVETTGSDASSNGSPDTDSIEALNPMTTNIPTTTDRGDPSMALLAASGAGTGQTTTSTSSQPQYNFGANSSTLDVLPAPTVSMTYSHFRNYNLPTSSSADTLTIPARHDSQMSSYSYTPDNDGKRLSVDGSSGEATLVSGQRYSPLSQTQTTTCMDNNRPESYGTRNISLHRASSSALNRSF